MSSVFIAGPASWNTLVVLDRLPEPVPHMQFAEDSWETLGGTSAGKALSLTALVQTLQGIFTAPEAHLGYEAVDLVPTQALD